MFFVRGFILTNATFDREFKEQYQFQVIAYNRAATTAMNPGTATATVLVTILDVNDQPPRFTLPNYVMHVNENMTSHTLVGQVTAIDADLPPNNQHTYLLDVSKVTGLPNHQTPIGKIFSVDQRTGRIFTNRVLDREEQSSYQLTIVARDNVIQSLHDSTIVTIHVSDVNDRSPVFNFPTPQNDTVYVTCDAPVGSSVTRIEASDDDEGDNARLQYFIYQLNGHRLFRVNSDTGELFVNGSLVEFDKDTFRLDIEVQDRGTPSHSAKTTLFVEVRPAQPVADAVSQAPTTGFLLQLLELPVNGQRLAIVVSVLAGCAVIIIASCVAACFVLRRQRKTRQYDDKTNDGRCLIIYMHLATA
jgi:protocadherin delta 1